MENLENLRTSDEVFIIGGGKSVKSIIPDPSVLQNKDVIACNNAYKLIPWAKVCIFADAAWLKQHVETLRNFAGKIVAVNGYINSLCDLTLLDKIFKRGKDHGITNMPNILNGSNTGHMAINLAYRMGYKKIYLIGFDMDDGVKETHWHNEHLTPSNTLMYNKNFIPNMGTIVPFCKSLDFEVYNLNPESRIKCFDFKNINDILH